MGASAQPGALSDSIAAMDKGGVRVSRNSVALAAAVLLLGAVAPGARGGEAEPSSGPPIGGKAVRFDVRAVTGPHKGTTLCYI